ncbi:hypothetical protein YC2023_077641 [Brassica napus]
MSSFHLNNILCCRLAVHPNASELVNTSKITKIETLTIGVIVTFVNNESVQRQFTMSKEIPGGMANIVDVRMLPGLLMDGELVGEEEVPTPQCLVDASGQSHKFRVKVIP